MNEVDSSYVMIIGHFRVPKSLTFTTFLVKMSFICMRMQNHFHLEGLALNLVLIHRPGELGNRLFIKHIKTQRKYSFIVEIHFTDSYQYRIFQTQSLHCI